MPESSLLAVNCEKVPKELIDQVKKERCVLFIGAGVSSEIGLPTGSELAGALARELNISTTALSQVAQIYQTKLGREALVNCVRRLIEKQPVITREVTSYDLLPAIEQLSRLIFTTNWDDHIEQAFKRKEKSIALARYNEHASLVKDQTHVVVKLHGDFDSKPDEIILTRDDYLHAYREVTKPGGLFTQLADALTTKTVLFVGYSLDDDDFDLLYDYVRESIGSGGRKHYAVMKNPRSDQIDYWRSRNITILDIAASELLRCLARQVRDFINREAERRYITGADAKPYTEFNGHAGSGKSELLHKIQEEYRLEEETIWLHACVDFEKHSTLEPLKLANELSQQTLNRPIDCGSLLERTNNDLRATEHLAAEELVKAWDKRRVVLLFDTSEQISPAIQRWIEYELVPAMQEHLVDVKEQVRMVIAGRKSVPWQNRFFTSPKRFRRIKLSPFDENAVGDMLDFYATLVSPDSVPRVKRTQLIADILDISAGHPGCIRKILEDIATRGFDVQADYVQANQEKLFNAFVHPILEEKILSRVPPETRPVIETISIFRRILSDFLDVLTEKGFLKNNYGDSMMLLGHLQDTHLVFKTSPPANMSELDPLVRRLLVWRMRLREPERYHKLNELALAIYEYGIAGQTWDGKPPSCLASPDLRASYIVEAIYHQLQHALVTSSFENVKASINGKIEGYLKALQSSVDKKELSRVLEAVIARLGDDPEQADSELLALAEHILGDGYQTLADPVQTFLKRASGGKENGK